MGKLKVEYIKCFLNYLQHNNNSNIKISSILFFKYSKELEAKTSKNVTDSIKDYTKQMNQEIIPNRGLPSDAGRSSAISEPGFEFRITKTFLLLALTLFTSETLTKSILFVNPKLRSLLFRPVNEAGTAAPVAISVHLHSNKNVIRHKFSSS